MKLFSSTLVSVSFLTVSLSAFGQFFPNNLAILRIGDGSATLANTGNAVFIDQYTSSGVFVNSVSVPSTGPNALILSGTATAEGALSRSADGQYLTFAAYNRAVGGSDSVSGSTVPRTIGVVSSSGLYSQGPSTTAFGNNSFRTAITDGANNYWGMGNGVGTYYFGNNAPAGFIQSTHTVNRVMNSFNGNLYFSYSSSSQSGPGIYGFSGMPTGTSAPSQFIATGAGSSPYDFAINSAGTIAYIADDRSISSGGGIQRWDLLSGVWTLSYTLGTGGTVGARGLAVDFSGANAQIFATTAETSSDRLISITDTGAGSAASTLATAGTKTIFRGLEFAPIQSVPEPSVMALAGLGLAAMILRRRGAKS